MSNILTATVAANAVRCETTDPRMLDLLPQVDMFIQRATGRDWTQDANIHATAVSAATMLLVQWYDNPAMIGDEGGLPAGLSAALTQLEAEALKYRKLQFTGLDGAGSISLAGARIGDQIVKLVGIYGVSGSQASKFETTISEDDQIEQTAGDDLSEAVFVVFLKSPGEDLYA